MLPNLTKLGNEMFQYLVYNSIVSKIYVMRQVMYKIFQTMIRNPLLIILPVIAVLLSAAAYMFLKSDMEKVMDSIAELTDMESFVEDTGLDDVIARLSLTLKSGVISIISGVMTVVFCSGYGNLQSAVLNGGKASLKVFKYGVKRFTGKVLLSFLLMVGIMYGVSFVMSLVTTPIMVAGFITEGGLSAGLSWIQAVLEIFLIIMTLVYPFIILWFPATFIDRYEPIIECLKNGLRAGRKKYFRLLPAIIVTMLPALIVFLSGDNLLTMYRSPGFILMFPYQIIVFPFFLTYIFFMYDSYRKENADKLKS